MKAYGFLLFLILPQSALGFTSLPVSRPLLSSSSPRNSLKASVSENDEYSIHHASTIAASFILASSIAFMHPQITYAAPATVSPTAKVSNSQSSAGGSSSPNSVASDPLTTLKSDVEAAKVKLETSIQLRNAAKQRLFEVKAVETKATENLAQSEKSYTIAKQSLIKVNDLLAKAKLKEANGDASAAKQVETLTVNVGEFCFFQ